MKKKKEEGNEEKKKKRKNEREKEGKKKGTKRNFRDIGNEQINISQQQMTEIIMELKNAQKIRNSSQKSFCACLSTDLVKDNLSHPFFLLF